MGGALIFPTFTYILLNDKNPREGSKLWGGGGGGGISQITPPSVEKPAWVGVGVSW